MNLAISGPLFQDKSKAGTQINTQDRQQCQKPVLYKNAEVSEQPESLYSEVRKKKF